MKNKLPKIINIAGITIIACSIIRWFFLFYDPSQMILGVGIGIIVCGFGYVYDWMKERERDLEKVNERLDKFTEWWTRQEME